jgi:hypothetical protein
MTCQAVITNIYVTGISAFLINISLSIKARLERFNRTARYIFCLIYAISLLLCLFIYDLFKGSGSSLDSLMSKCKTITELEMT